MNLNNYIVWILAILLFGMAVMYWRLYSKNKINLVYKSKYNALLKLKRLDVAPLSVPNIAIPAQKSVPVIKEWWLINPSDNRTEAVIGRASIQAWNSADALQIDKKRLSKFGGVLQHAPALALSAATASQDLYSLTFSSGTSLLMAVGDVYMPAASNGCLRAVAIDSATGRIIEHGDLSIAGGLQIASVGVAAWTILTVLVGKKYLHDINQRLDSIETGIQSIKSRLDNQIYGRLCANAGILRRYAWELQDESVSRNHSNSLMNECLTISRITKGDFEAIRLDHSSALNFLDAASNSEKMSEDNVLGSYKAVEEAWSKLRALDFTVNILAGCENLRMSLNFSNEVAACELENLSVEFNKIYLQHERSLKKFADKLARGDKPWIIGKDKFVAAQNQGLKAVNKYKGIPLDGSQYCVAAASAIREKYLSAGPVTLLFNRARSGEIVEARIVNR